MPIFLRKENLMRRWLTIKTKTLNRHEHHRYAGMAVNITPSSRLHAREPGGTRRYNAGLMRRTYSPSAVVEPRIVSGKRYKDQYALSFGLGRSLESERAITL